MMKEKRGRYAQFLRPPELLESDPIDEEAGEVLTLEHLHLYRLTDQGYEEAPRQPNGRVRSAVLDLEFGVDTDANLRLYTLSGDPLLTYEEEQQARRAAEQAHHTAEQARHTAEQARRTAEQGRRTAEQRLEQEAQERLAAEQRAAEERAQREVLEREVAELRARLAREGS
jgi:hypothetical protein